MSKTAKLKEYVASLEEACGEEKDFIAVLKYEKKEEAMKRIMERGQVIKSISGIAFDVSFKNASIRLYKTGKLLIKKLKDKKEAEEILEKLIL